MLDDFFDGIRNGLDTMRANPAGVMGMFLMPFVILGFAIATNLINFGFNGTAASLIANSGVCNTPQYILFGWPLGVIAVNLQCLIINFNPLALLAYYAELLVIVFIGSMIGINVLHL